nr:Imm49 family immunity protein [Niveibacterium umoris]
MIRAARVRERYLELVRKDGLVDDHHFCAGRIEGFLAACAAEDFALARTIASLSPGAWRSGHEYEDDFCYAQALFNLLAPQRDGVALAAICARWKGALKGAPGNRLAVIEALRSNDASAFEASFEGLLDERAERISADIARGQLEEAPVIADRLVYVEGLALLRIARRLGFPLQPDYRYCPSLAMQAMVKPFPGE